VEEGRLTPAIASLAKMSNAEKAKAVVGEARDLLGGNGILLDNEVGRHLGDVEVVSTVEGTDIVHALIVGREITGLSAFT
jgi:glutaryl-CoA dehydrogenase